MKTMFEAFMKPEVFKSKGVAIDTSVGTMYLPDDVIKYSGQDTEDQEEIKKNWEQIKDYVEVFKPEDVYSISHADGWFGRLTAPGYLDSTPYQFGKTEKEVKKYLQALYGDEDGGTL